MLHRVQSVLKYNKSNLSKQMINHIHGNCLQRNAGCYFFRQNWIISTLLENVRYNIRYNRYRLLSYASIFSFYSNLKRAHKNPKVFCNFYERTVIINTPYSNESTVFFGFMKNLHSTCTSNHCFVSHSYILIPLIFFNCISVLFKYMIWIFTLWSLQFTLHNHDF